MILEYALVAAAFGVSSYFGLYRKARNRAKETLKLDKDTKAEYTITFVVWTVFTGIAMPLMLPSYLFLHDITQEKVYEAILEHLVEEI